MLGLRGSLQGLLVPIVIVLFLLAAAPVASDQGREVKSPGAELRARSGSEAADPGFRPDEDCEYAFEGYQHYSCIGEGDASVWLGGVADACTVAVEIDWGDGNMTSHQFEYPPAMEITHSYAESGLYIATVTGQDLDTGPACTEGQLTFTFEVVPVLGFSGKAAERTRYLTDYTRSVLLDILKAARLRKATITSTYRTAWEQANEMYRLLEKPGGVRKQKELYGDAGDQVIRVYLKAKVARKSKPEIIELMTKKIIQLGPCNVSHHSCDPVTSHLNTIDVAPSSVARREAFVESVRRDLRVACFLQPPKDEAYHLEIPQPDRAPAPKPCKDRLGRFS